MPTPNEDGRIMTRREAIVLLGAASLSAALASGEVPAADTATPSCVLSPALEKSPSFVDERLNRSDLTANSANRFVTTAFAADAGSDRGEVDRHRLHTLARLPR